MDNIQTIKEDARRRRVPIIRDKSHALLEEITESLNPINILEIGTAVGYSGISMLAKAKNASLITIELDQNKVIEARENFKNAGMEDRATVINADCVQELEKMASEGSFNKYFDLVFLDGPKGQYINMLESIISLTKGGGTVVADNVLFRGYVDGSVKMPRRFKTIVKRLHMLFDAVKSHPQIAEHKLYDIEDGVLVFKLK